MLTLNLEAPTFPELVQKAFQALGVSVGSAPAAPAEATRRPDVAADTCGAASAEGEGQPATAGAADPPVKRARGRPRRVELPVAGAVPAETGSSPATQAAVVENTASEPAGNVSPAEGASAATDSVLPGQNGSSAESVAVETFDTMKAALQALAAKDGGAGLRAVTPILHEFGYESVKAIKDHPEHWGPIAAKARAAL